MTEVSKIRVGLVDDQALVRTGFAMVIDSQDDMKVVLEASNGKIALERLTVVPADVILMDIQMTNVDGMTAARAIREADQEVVLVFITSAAQFAIHGYQVGALSYLMKPLPWFAFSQELSRCLQAVTKRRGASVLLQSGTSTHRIDVADIVYVESIKHRLDVHTTSGTYSITSSLKAMEEQLDGHDLFRSNSCYLVNLAHVRGVADQECLLSGGERLRISRPRKKAFMSALASFAGGIH